MLLKIKGTLLDLIEKEYEFEDKKGISYQLIIYSEGVLQKVKVNKEIFEEYKFCLNQEIELECNVFIKGSYSLSLKG